MAHTLTFKKMLSRVREVFPSAPETYCMELANDSLTELGKYNVKHGTAKFTTTADTAWYSISDSAVGGTPYNLNKLYKVSFMDEDGYYIQIPRLVDGDVSIEDET